MYNDMINSPQHYQAKNGVECIQAIEAATEELQGLEAVCTANVIKYIWRWKKKNGVEDLKKAKWYLEKLIGVEESSIAHKEKLIRELVEKHSCKSLLDVSLPSEGKDLQDVGDPIAKEKHLWLEKGNPAGHFDIISPSYRTAIEEVVVDKLKQILDCNRKESDKI